jgi:hypothetical protein
MDAVLLIAGLFVLWIWLHGHPIGALAVFVAMASPALLIDPPFTMSRLAGLVAYLGVAAVVALAPRKIIGLYRDSKKEHSIKSGITYKTLWGVTITALVLSPVGQHAVHSMNTAISALINYHALRVMLAGFCAPPAIACVAVSIAAAWGAFKEAMKPRPRQALPTLGLTLPGLEEAIASHGGSRRSESRGPARQTVNKPVPRPRVEPTFDKPIR